MSLVSLKKINDMHFRFGKSDGRCKECSNFSRYRYRDHKYSKCRVYGITLSAATDWNGRYEACGLFNKDYKGKPIIDLRHPRKEEKEDNQMSLLEMLT